MVHVPSGKWSTGALMRVIVPVALELVLFQEVWWIVLAPPVTLAVLVINLGALFVLVRPKSWEPRIVGMMLAGIAAPLAVIAYYVSSGFERDQVGVFGRLYRDVLNNWADSLANPAGDLGTALRSMSRHMTEIEGVLVVLFGVAMIWAGGRLDQWRRDRSTRDQQASQTRSMPRETDPAIPSR